MLDRVSIKTHAKKILSENYWTIIGAVLILSAISFFCGVIPYVGFIASVAAVPIITLGCCYLSVLLYRGEKPSIEVIFDGFRNFTYNLGGYWWMMLFIFLWSLLFWIPGIIKTYAYCMTPYILMDQPEVDAQEALKKSMKMTEGHKMDIFVMHLSFLGWCFLSVFTFGILAVFYVTPYMALTMAGYYVVLRSQEVYGNGGYYNNQYQQPGQYQQPSYWQPVPPQYQPPIQPQQMPYQEQQLMQTQNPEQAAAPDIIQQSQNPDENNPYMTPIE